MNIPQVIANRFEPRDKLGEGGMGTVYRGVDRQTGESVAIKALKPEVIASDPGIVERFAREGEALRVLNHPNIVKVLATEKSEQGNYIIMEYVSGGSLRELLDEQSPLPVKRVLEITLDLADALTRAHRLNIIHRDIKPANVLVADDGMPRLTDFGVAHFGNNQRVTQTGTAVGTLDYLCPESLNGESVDGGADIWAFGVMLFEMLVGRRPFDEASPGALLTAILSKPVPDLEKLRPDVPVALVDLIYRMLEKDRHQRIPSVRQVGTELEAIIQGYTTTPISSHPAVLIERFGTPTPATKLPKHNLPTPATPFVGRDKELSALAKLFDDPTVRLVTIVGPGGMGKTRLALETARHLWDADGEGETIFSNGVYFVPLAPLSSPDAIPAAIAEAVKFSFHSAENPVQQLLDYLREKHLLLVIDNFEHVIAGATIVADILRTAPTIKILATSRERLNLQGESLFQIGSMDFPDYETPQTLEDFAAVKLFLQSARRSQPGFELSAQDRPYIARICRLVQGMPLGIELGAAWVGTLTLDEIAKEIESSLDFLETEMRDVPERHRSIRAVFEYSWNLLSTEERTIFSQLAVFRGGFTRDAAMAITGAALRNLSALVNKSLLRRDPDGRYQVHELLRQYAENQLGAASSDVTKFYDSHCAYYAAQLEKRLFDLQQGNQREADTELMAELDNLRSAFQWARDHAKIHELIQMSIALPWLCQMHSLYLEGQTVCRDIQRVLNTVPSTPEVQQGLLFLSVFAGWFYIRLGQLGEARRGFEAARGKFETLPPSSLGADPYSGLALLASIEGNYQQALELGEKSLQLSEQRQDNWSKVTAYYVMASATFGQGKYETARDYTQRALAIIRQGGDRWFTAYLINDLGNVERALGNYAEARQHFQTSYTIRKELADPEGMAVALNHLGKIALLEADFGTAKELYQQGYALYKDIGDKGGLATALTGLGSANGALGEYAEARNYLRMALRITSDTHLAPLTLAALATMGELHMKTGQPERGIELLALAAHHTSSPHETAENARQLLSRYQTVLAPNDFQAVVEHGKALDLDSLVASLLKEK